MQSKYVQRQENWRCTNYRVKTQKDGFTSMTREDGGKGGWVEKKEERRGRKGKGSCLIAVVSPLDKDDSRP